ncbi:MAG: hypothetical protein K2P81_02310 [Bacteriovoracaceae bacterium]|nr:hypothetical protein [Bacteriovoracaceae bacterium]
MRFLFFIFLSFSALAQNNCAQPLSLEEFGQFVENVRSQYFSDIPKEHLGIKSFRSEAYFLQAQPYLKTLINRRQNRRYNVQINLRLLECPPTPEGLEAILVHELEHVRDYMGWSSGHIALHGGKYALSCGVKVKYERATDAKVLELGLGEGLAQYREWVYQWLSPKDLAKKRLIYLTPEEIRGQTF